MQVDEEADRTTEIAQPSRAASSITRSRNADVDSRTRCSRATAPESPSTPSAHSTSNDINNNRRYDNLSGCYNHFHRKLVGQSWDAKVRRDHHYSGYSRHYEF